MIVSTNIATPDMPPSMQTLSFRTLIQVTLTLYLLGQAREADAVIPPRVGAATVEAGTLPGECEADAECNAKVNSEEADESAGEADAEETAEPANDAEPESEDNADASTDAQEEEPADDAEASDDAAVTRWMRMIERAATAAIG